jgi:hypothetical protein
MTLLPMPASHATISFLMLDPSTVVIDTAPSLRSSPTLSALPWNGISAAL